MRRTTTFLAAVLAASALAMAGCASPIEAPGPPSGAAPTVDASDGAGAQDPAAPSGSANAPSGSAMPDETGRPGASGAPAYGTVAGGVVSGEDEELIPLTDLPEPVRGSGSVRASDAGPVDGKVRVIIYQDMMCPYCKQFDDKFGETLATWADEGDVVVDHRVVSILDGHSTSEYSTRSANALACVADQAPQAYSGALRELYKALEAESGSGGSGNAGLTNDQLVSALKAAGVPDSVESCVEEEQFRAWVKTATERATADGLRATPTVIVGGEVWDTSDPDFEAWARKVIDAES